METLEKKIILTGGGTAGHVTPNLALIKKLRSENWEISYIGSKNGIEKELIAKTDVPFFSIATGKFRRCFSLKNFIDPFKIIFGILQAFFIIRKIKPKVIFSKGGFVAFPVVVAAWLKHIPVIIHESDLTVGLANKLCFPFVTKICVTFPETAKHIKNQNKVVVTGTPIREEFFQGNAELGRKICGFTANKKVMLVFGGSLGSDAINKIIRKLLPEILETWQIVHVCGENKIDLNYDFPGYKQFAYLHEEFPHVIAAADLVISRAGANTIYELIALRKPNVLIPLSKNASRGDQIINAKYCERLGVSQVIFEEDLTKELLLEKINMVVAIKKIPLLDSINLIMKLL